MADVTTKTNASVWTGRALSALVVLFLLMDAGMKLAVLQPVIDTTATLGWPTEANFLRGLGLVLLLCTVLYALPQTAILGAILLTGYLGGVVATHVRIASPLFSHVLFGVYLGALLWGGLYLRDPRVRALLPLRA